MKRLLFILFTFCSFSLWAQMVNPAHFKVSQKRISPTEIEVTFSGTIEEGWHVYSTTIPSGGPTAATFNFERGKKVGIETEGALKAVGNEKSNFDNNFGMTLRYFENSVRFVQRLRITAQQYEAKAYLEYGACNDENCTAPQQVDVIIKGTDGPKTETGTSNTASPEKSGSAITPESSTQKVADIPSQPENEAAEMSAQQDTLPLYPTSISSFTVADKAQWWQSSVKDLQQYESDGQTAGRSLWMIFLLGCLGGLIALLTPCVWPIIPMTVSFFLHRSENRRRALRDAMGYGLSILVIYVGLGLLLTIWRGPDAMNALATNAVVNIFFFLLLVIFGVSFLGGFELTLPEKWTNAVNNKSESTTGWISIFLMALTLTLVSFSCTGPIIGFLLVDISTNGSFLAPTVGMFGFALALALPFTLFALFPTWLKKAPKSGQWMNTVKVTLGFIELAFALKFLSVADLAYGWHILDRETFLSLWIVLFALLGMYLLGRLKFPHDNDDNHTGVVRFLMGLCSLAFAVYMVPGLWGAPLKAVSAFAPPLSTQDFKLDQHEVKAQFKSYEEGMAYARSVGKPVMIDFTGYGCVNCRKMELAVWYDKQVADILNNEYVLISLYVDDKAPLDTPMEVDENGQTRTLRTVGALWSHLQSTKFGAQTQPFYVLLDNNGKPLSGAYSYKESISEFVDFLQNGLAAYRNR